MIGKVFGVAAILTGFFVITDLEKDGGSPEPVISDYPKAIRIGYSGKQGAFYLNFILKEDCYV